MRADRRAKGPSPRRAAGARAWALIATAWTRGALAQTDPEVTRRAIIQEAAAAAQAGRHADAIALARRALEIRASSALHFLLAREELAVSLPLEAHGHAVRCSDEARDDPGVTDRAMLLERCGTLMREAARALTRLTVEAPSPSPAGLRVSVDGLPLDERLLGVAVLRLPGPVELRATAHDRAPLRVERVLVAGGDEVVRLVFAAPTPPPPPSRPPPVPPTYGRRDVSYAGPWSFGAAALASAVSTGILGGLALSAQSERDRLCPAGGSCDLAGAQAADARYRDLALGVNVSLAVTGVLVGVALVWWGVTRANASRAAPPTLSLSW